MSDLDKAIALAKKISAKIPEKKKRGRPSILTFPNDEKYLRGIGENRVKDIRTLHNLHYQARATRLLGLAKTDHPKFPYHWLTNPAGQVFGKSMQSTYKATIIAELGRIKDKDDMKSAAKEICRLKPKTKDAVKMIRGWRLGRGPEVPSLEAMLHDTAEKYIEKYPNVTRKDAQEVFRILAKEF